MRDQDPMDRLARQTSPRVPLAARLPVPWIDVAQITSECVSTAGTLADKLPVAPGVLLLAVALLFLSGCPDPDPDSYSFGTTTGHTSVQHFVMLQ